MSVNFFTNSLRSSSAIRSIIEDSKPNYDNIVLQGIQDKVADAQFRAEQSVANYRTAVGSKTDKELTDKAIKNAAELRGIEKRGKFAGKLAAGLTTLGAAALLNNKKEKDNPLLPLLQKQQSFYQNQINNAIGTMSDLDSQIADLNNKVDTTPSVSSATSTGTAPLTASDPPKSSNLGGKKFDLSKLTDDDYKELGFAISSEAALNTDDEFGVAANILTRLQSGKYGNSIGEIIRAKGQYEGVYTGKSRYSPEIEARLKSPEGQKKIQEFFTILDGRTEFKGQTQLKNRVKAEDPMFDPRGNFYHYSWQ